MRANRRTANPICRERFTYFLHVTNDNVMTGIRRFDELRSQRLGFVGFSQEQCRLDFECLSSHMPQGFSKKNQSSVDTAYRFGDFELHPRDRLLKRASTPIALQPKAFDALLCLVRRAQHLVSKQE